MQARLPKPPSAMTSMHASDAPATITSALPCATVQNASPIAFAPAAHAVEGACMGPRRPHCRLTSPAAILGKTRGTKYGLSLQT